MSIFGKVAGWFEGAVGSALDVARKAWGSIHTVWTFLVNIGNILSGAWDWMVNGVTWFTSQAENWAAAVFTMGWHTVTNLIPKAALWAFRKADEWASRQLHALGGFLRGLIKNVSTWALRELKALARDAKGWVASVIRWVTAPIRWIYHVAKGAIEMVLHPEALVKWILGDLVVPLIFWLLRSSAPVIAWLIKSAVARDSEVAHLMEDVLAKVI